jgi:hypothetical protein
MGKKSSSPQYVFMPQQQSTAATTENKLPDWVQQAGRSNYEAAANMSPDAFTPYSGQRVADMNAGQLNAINAFNQNMGASNAAYDTAIRDARGATAAGTGMMGSAARGIASSLNPSSVNQSIYGLQSAANRGFERVNDAGQAYQPIDYSGNFQFDATNGYREVSNPGQVFNPISLNGLGFSPINASELGYQNVSTGRNPTIGAQAEIRRALGSADPAIDAAMAGTMRAAEQANRIGNVSSRDVEAQTLPQGNLEDYLNPFTNNVVNSSLAVLDQQRRQALNQDADAAINAKAFGGSRQAIQEAATNSQYGLQGAQLAANLNSQNYNQAVSNLQSDQARNLQAQQANQAAAMQAALANQQMGLDRSNLGLSASNQLGSLGLNALSGRAQAASTLGNLGLDANAQNLQASLANQQAGLTNQSQVLDALRANQASGLDSRGMDLQAAQANQQAEIERARLGQSAQMANQDAFLAANGQNLDALQANAALGLQNKGMNIGAQQQNAQLALEQARLNQAGQLANQNAGLQSQQNAISALQNSGQLGLGLGNLNLSGYGAIGNLGQDIGNLGLSSAQTRGALTGQREADYLNSINSAFQGSGLLQAQEQNKLLADREAYADRQAAMLGPLNLRMQALGMTPYNTSTSSTGSSSGFTSQLYQPTSNSPFMGLLGAGLTGLRAASGLGWQPLAR